MTEPLLGPYKNKKILYKETNRGLGDTSSLPSKKCQTKAVIAILYSSFRWLEALYPQAEKQLLFNTFFEDFKKNVKSLGFETETMKITCWQTLIAFK